MSWISIARRLSVVTTVALAACSSESTSPARTAASVSAASSVSRATVGRAAPSPFQVRVTDDAGAPVAGTAVTWAIAAGGGSLSAASATTDADGVASTIWTPGTAAGEGALTATAAGMTARFPVELTADAPVAMTMLAGDVQEALVGSELATPFSLQVRDRFGNGVMGVGVRWTARTTDAGDVLFDVSPSTDATGKAFALFRLGSDAGERNVIATVDGLGDVAFKVNAFLPPPVEPTLPDTAVVGLRGLRRK